MTTLRTLECLVALVEHCSVSKAAATLHMSQPAVSHQIAALERELGAPVVERLARGVRVTSVGRAAAEQALISRAFVSGQARAACVYSKLLVEPLDKRFHESPLYAATAA